LNESNHILHFQKTYLTDIAIIQISTIKFCIEECFNNNKLITMLVALSEKIWGKWFYASPAIDQYEETTASLVGFQRLSKR
jgi:hypothetical protein